MGSYRYNKIQNEIKSEVVTEYCCIEAYEKCGTLHKTLGIALPRLLCLCASVGYYVGHKLVQRTPTYILDSFFFF